MLHRLACVLSLIGAVILPVPVAVAGQDIEVLAPFRAASGETVDAYSGQLMVPENWNVPDSRRIPLSYVRFPATGNKRGAPVVYLSGGPGGSGIETARRERFPLFMAMREFGDVIALDQRGTGASSSLPKCRSTHFVRDDQRYSDAEFAELHLQAARECLAFWQQAGVDIRGYTTAQSVRDLDALRRHLGARKISLWGISYGSHLALAALKSMDRHIERVVLASVEGLDQTVKSPAETDAYFARLQAAITAHPQLADQLPDIVALMQRVHARLDAEPLTLQLPLAGGNVEFLLERRDMQQFASMMIADPAGALRLLMLYSALDHGVHAPLLGVLARVYTPGQPIEFSPMPLAMDVASGINRDSLRKVREEAATALLGDYLNFPMPQLDGLLPELDLGDGFRSAPRSKVPVLAFSGTLDGRTYPRSQREALVSLSNVRIVEVINGGHNLFMLSPEITARIQAFMAGETVSEAPIEVPLASP